MSPIMSIGSLMCRLRSNAASPQASHRLCSSISGQLAKYGSTALEERLQPGNDGVDVAEVGKFSALAATWWDPTGAMAPLHSMNPTRVRFIRQALSRRFRKQSYAVEPLAGLQIADIGSGAGILSESLARLGAAVTGVDASREAVAAAHAHAGADRSLAGRLHYREGTAEGLAADGATFDAVIASEVIEHVPDPEVFCRALTALARPSGQIVISTLNRTPRAYALAVFGAERLLGALPLGTHDWSNFITPDELAMAMQAEGWQLDQIRGMTIGLLSQQWSLTSDVGVNYIAAFVKSGPA